MAKSPVAASEDVTEGALKGKRFVNPNLAGGVRVDSNQMPVGSVLRSKDTSGNIAIGYDMGVYGARQQVSTVIAETYPPAFCGGTWTLADNTAYFAMLNIHRTATVTGVCWLQHTQGNYTADQTSQVALYSSNGTTLTNIASCADDTALWKAASSTVGTKAFTSSAVVSPGIYYVGLLYNNSAETTAPVIRSAANQTGALTNVLMSGSNLHHATLAAQNSLPATTQALSGLSASGSTIYIGLY